MMSDQTTAHSQPSAMIFGGSGFIGTHLVAALVDRGWQVTIADLVPPAELCALTRYEHCDVRRPITVAAGHFDLVVNLAAVHRTPGHSPHEYYETNVAGALNITAWMERSDARALWFTSSIAVYGPSEEVKSESSELEPDSDYGRSKVMAEEVFRRWQGRAQARRLVITRPAVVFGSGEHGNFTRLAGALRRRTFAYPGRRDVIKSAGYVEDLVKALLFADAADGPVIVFNFCYPHRSTIEEICQAFHAVAGYRLPPTVPQSLVGGLVRFLALINPTNRGALAAGRVKKLTASTNIAAEVLHRLGFEWDTDLVSGLRAWSEDSGGQFV